MTSVETMTGKNALERLESLVGSANVATDLSSRQEAGSDRTENEPHLPDAIVKVSELQTLRAVVELANQSRIPLVPRVAGTNLGGLTIPVRGGWTLDLTGMNRIVELNESDLVAVIEPGVTFGQLADELARLDPPLTVGFPLSPPETSVMANCLLDGLGNLSLKHGAMGDWVQGLEVVRADGSLLNTGVGALGVPVPFGRAPLPDLTGLFLSWQGTTGIVSKLALTLWPEPRFRERSFVLCYDRAAVLRALAELPRLEILNDLGGLSWSTGKMLFGVEEPRERDPAEPEFFFYVDVGASTKALFDAKRRALLRYLSELRQRGLRVDDPLDVDSLVKLEPRLGRLARFPTRLDFLLDHPGGGLTWVGTYGPTSKFGSALERGMQVVEHHGFVPMIVARPMRGGHFSVLRFILVFDKADRAAVDRVRACNQEVCDALLNEGFVMYKTPAWALERYRGRLDPGFARLVAEIHQLLDPNRIMNPGHWEIE